MIAGIYSRISQDAEDTGDATRRQEQDCHALAVKKGWTVAEVYRDNDVSATKSKPRPAYQRMMKDLRDGKINAVLVYDVDRLTRHPMELEEFILLADSHGVQLDNVAGNIDLSSDDGRLMARIKGSLAKAETDKMSKRLKRQRQQHMEEGRPPVGGRYRTFGYTRDWQIIEPEAEIIRDAYRRVLVGESLQAIADRWRDDGVVIGEGKIVYRSTVRGIVTRGLYAGLSVHKGEIVGKSQVPPIIDETTFYAVSEALKGSSVTRPMGKNARRYYLSGIVRCTRCLLPMTGGPNAAKTRGRPNHRYTCRGASGGCGMSVTARRLESLVLEVVRQNLIVTSTKTDRVDYQPQIDQLDKEIEQVHEARRNGLSITDAIQMINDLTADKKAVLRLDAAQLTDDEVAFTNWEDFKTASLSEQKAITNAIIEIVLVSPANSTGFDPDRVEIHLNNKRILKGSEVSTTTPIDSYLVVDGFRPAHDSDQ